jgi:hypothetical protein
MTAPAGEREVSERILSRAKGILWQAAITIKFVDDQGRVAADAGGYRVRRSPGGKWSCQCAAATYGNPCSHVEAVRLVT